MNSIIDDINWYIKLNPISKEFIEFLVKNTKN